MIRILGLLGRSLWQGLIGYGLIYVTPEHPESATYLWPWGDALAGPVGGHPERVLHGAPLSEQEERILRELWPSAADRQAHRPQGPPR